MSVAMYSQNNNAAMAPPQKPETFMLSDAAQQNLPQDAQVALQQVDNRKHPSLSLLFLSKARYCHVAISRSAEVTDILTSQILSHLGSSRLDARSIYTKISIAYGGICVLRTMVRIYQSSLLPLCGWFLVDVTQE